MFLINDPVMIPALDSEIPGLVKEVRVDVAGILGLGGRSDGLEATSKRTDGEDEEGGNALAHFPADTFAGSVGRVGRNSHDAERERKKNRWSEAHLFYCIVFSLLSNPKRMSRGRT